MWTFRGLVLPQIRKPCAAVRRQNLRILAAAVVMLGLPVALLILAGCGRASSPSGTEHYTPPPGVQQPHAYLYSRVDYPLQIPVNQSDTVTLTLSPQSNILEVTPSAGQGQATVGEPIPLPTDLRGYQDVGARVDTSGTGPILWQLTSPIQQSLLTPATPGAARHYLDEVDFTWHVQAISGGQNLVKITLHLYYVYLDGSEKDGSIQVSQAPIPIQAVAATPANTFLPNIKLPIAGLSGLAGIFAFFRFIWGAYKAVDDVTQPARDAIEVASKVRARMAGQQGQPSQQGQPLQSQQQRWPPPSQGQGQPPASYPWPQGGSAPLQGQPPQQRQPLRPPMPPVQRRDGPLMPPHGATDQRNLRLPDEGQ